MPRWMVWTCGAVAIVCALSGCHCLGVAVDAAPCESVGPLRPHPPGDAHPLVQAVQAAAHQAKWLYAWMVAGVVALAIIALTLVVLVLRGSTSRGACWLLAILWFCPSAFAADPVHMMDLPKDVRAWYRNPDGSCVQCSIGMCGVWQNIPSAYTLLWKTQYGPAVRGGSWPARVEDYAERRQMPIYNVTGQHTWDWMRWAAKTGRFAAIGAGGAHFQTLYGWDPNRDRWYVCNNNSTSRVDEYSWENFRRLHLASGQWIVVLDAPPPPAVPRYVKWW